MADLKAWSHGVRKANCIILKILSIYVGWSCSGVSQVFYVCNIFKIFIIHRTKEQTSTSSEKSTNTKNNTRTTKSESHLSKVEKSNSKMTEDNVKTAVDSIKSDSELSHSYEGSSEFNDEQNIVSKNDVVDGVKSDSEINKSDGESGLGSSVSVSPDDSKLDENDQYTNIAISLCGDLRRGKVSYGKAVRQACLYQWRSQPDDLVIFVIFSCSKAVETINL